MAKIPTDKQTEILLASTEKADEAKRLSQEKQGKDFVNHGQGVIPETVWKNLPGKQIDDPEGVK